MAVSINYNPFTGSLEYVTESGAGSEQTLGLVGNTLSISGGNSIDLTPYSPQSLDLTGNTLSLSDSNSVDLSTYANVNQTLNLTGDTLSISNGNSVDLSVYIDEATIEIVTVIQSLIDGTGWNLPGPYRNESSAATAGVAIGQAYYDNSGTVRARQT
jgi:hypothetical protein